jgi:hypothetical protein
VKKVCCGITVKIWKDLFNMVLNCPTVDVNTLLSEFSGFHPDLLAVLKSGSHSPSCL